MEGELIVEAFYQKGKLIGIEFEVLGKKYLGVAKGISPEIFKFRDTYGQVIQRKQQKK